MSEDIVNKKKLELQEKIISSLITRKLTMSEDILSKTQMELQATIINSGDFLKLKHMIDSILTEIDKGKTFTFVISNRAYDHFYRLNKEFGLVTFRKDAFNPYHSKLNGHALKVSINYKDENSELTILKEMDLLIISTKNYLWHCPGLRDKISHLIRHSYRQVNEQYFSEK